MGPEGVAPGLHTSHPHPDHRPYPYLFRDETINRPNHAWCVDITFVPTTVGFMYLVVVMDWCSRYVIGWVVSKALELGFCLDGLEHLLDPGYATDFQ